MPKISPATRTATTSANRRFDAGRPRRAAVTSDPSTRGQYRPASGDPQRARAAPSGPSTTCDRGSVLPGLGGLGYSRGGLEEFARPRIEYRRGATAMREWTADGLPATNEPRRGLPAG